MWKYVDDTVISEVGGNGQQSCIQQVLDVLVRQPQDVSFQPNERKFNELRISFARNELDLDPICANGQTLETEEREILLLQDLV